MRISERNQHVLSYEPCSIDELLFGPDQQVPCDQCGALVLELAAFQIVIDVFSPRVKLRKQHRFCSDACRTAWWCAADPVGFDLRTPETIETEPCSRCSDGVSIGPGCDHCASTGVQGIAPQLLWSVDPAWAERIDRDLIVLVFELPPGTACPEVYEYRPGWDHESFVRRLLSETEDRGTHVQIWQECVARKSVNLDLLVESYVFEDALMLNEWFKASTNLEQVQRARSERASEAA